MYKVKMNGRLTYAIQLLLHLVCYCYNYPHVMNFNTKHMKSTTVTVTSQFCTPIKLKIISTLTSEGDYPL
jgi:hypothetical protein